jgi:ribulose kinase
VGALGCAILCARSCGVYSDIEEAANAMSHIQETIEPSQKHRRFYDEKFELYRTLHEHTQEESSFASIRN